MNDWTWILLSVGAGLLLGAMIGRNMGTKGRRMLVGGPEATGALHNQDMWYWIKYHEKQRQQQAASLQQPTAMPTQAAMQQQPLNVQQITAQQALRAQQMQQPGLATQQQGLSMQAQQQLQKRQQNVPHYFF